MSRHQLDNSTHRQWIQKYVLLCTIYDVPFRKKTYNTAVVHTATTSDHHATAYTTRRSRSH